jgi:dTDP-4-amino-4,6-dideoxygalactose transaminase
MGIGNDLIGDVERLMADRVLRQRALHRMIGPTSQCWRAEGEIEAMYPRTRCLLLPSATVGLALVLELLELEPGREVLIPAFGWLSNWSCIRRAGLVPRFLPLDEDLQLRVEAVAERLTACTGAVIVTHLMGRGHQEVAAIAEVCAERGIPLLEDVAQSFGVSIRGQRAGTFGLAAWCSLNHNKLVSTGDGGFVLSTDEDFFERLCAHHDQGCVLHHGKRRPAASVEPGLSLRTNELVAAVLRGQMARFALVRGKVLSLHDALSAALRGRYNVRIVAPHFGDLPFTVLFERPHDMNYPSLAESGWHVAANVPWLTEAHVAAAADDPTVARTLETLAGVSAVGAGFVDPYYAVPVGVGITEGAGSVARTIAALEKSA